VEKSPSEAYSRLDSHDISRIYGTQGSLPARPLPWARRIQYACSLTRFRKIHFNCIIPSIAMSSKWSLPFRFMDQNFVCISQRMIKLWAIKFLSLEFLRINKTRISNLWTVIANKIVTYVWWRLGNKTGYEYPIFQFVGLVACFVWVWNLVYHIKGRA
jgi:hypothetical protein